MGIVDGVSNTVAHGFNAVNPMSHSNNKGGDFNSRATAGQSEGQSADGQTNAQASNFANESHEVEGGPGRSGESFSSQSVQNTSSETHDDGSQQPQQSNGGGFGGFGGSNGQQQSDDAQGNAEGAAGQAFSRVSRAMGPKQGGMTGHAEGVSGTQGQQFGDPHGQMGSATVNKSQGQQAFGDSAPTDEFANDGMTNTVRENM